MSEAVGGSAVGKKKNKVAPTGPRRRKVAKRVGESLSISDKCGDKCKVCQHPEAALVETLYIDHANVSWLADKCGASTESIVNHMTKKSLRAKRDENIQGFYREVRELGLKALQEGLVDPDIQARLAMDAQKHLDKVEGRLVNKVEVEENRTIRLEAFPIPGGFLPAQAEIIEGEIEEDATAPREEEKETTS